MPLPLVQQHFRIIEETICTVEKIVYTINITYDAYHYLDANSEKYLQNHVLNISSLNRKYQQKNPSAHASIFKKYLKK